MEGMNNFRKWLWKWTGQYIPIYTCMIYRLRWLSRSYSACRFKSVCRRHVYSCIGKILKVCTFLVVRYSYRWKMMKENSHSHKSVVCMCIVRSLKQSLLFHLLLLGDSIYAILTVNFANLSRCRLSFTQRFFHCRGGILLPDATACKPEVQWIWTCMLFDDG